MSLKDLTAGENVEDTNTDVLPGTDFNLTTGLYEMLIDVAFMDTNPATGSEALKLHLKMADGSPRTLRTAFYVRSGTEKGNNTFYVTQDGKQRSLMGFIQGNQVTEITCGKPMKDLKEEEKIIKLWNNASKTEENTKIRYLPELHNKPILLGVLKIRDNKRDWKVKEGKDYKRLPQETFFNEVDKVFYPNGMSTKEKNTDAKTPEFRNRWAALYGEKTVDRYQEVAGSQPDLPVHSPIEGTPVSSLFSKDDE